MWVDASRGGDEDRRGKMVDELFSFDNMYDMYNTYDEAI